MGRKKKIEKALNSYKKQKELHKRKIEILCNKKSHLREYWEKEMDRKIIENRKKLEKY